MEPSSVNESVDGKNAAPAAANRPRAAVQQVFRTPRRFQGRRNPLGSVQVIGRASGRRRHAESCFTSTRGWSVSAAVTPVPSWAWACVRGCLPRQRTTVCRHLFALDPFPQPAARRARCSLSVGPQAVSPSLHAITQKMNINKNGSPISAVRTLRRLWIFAVIPGLISAAFAAAGGTPQASLTLLNSDAKYCYTHNNLWTLTKEVTANTVLNGTGSVTWTVSAIKSDGGTTFSVHGGLTILNSGTADATIGNIVVNLQRPNSPKLGSNAPMCPWRRTSPTPRSAMPRLRPTSWPERRRRMQPRTRRGGSATTRWPARRAPSPRPPESGSRLVF